MSSDYEGEDCPLCCTELDLTDRSIQYCACGCEWPGGMPATCHRGAGRRARGGGAAPPPAAAPRAARAACPPAHSPAHCAALRARRADHMCLWCYHHILEEAGKENVPARCPNCRSEYDQEKITVQQIDGEK